MDLQYKPLTVEQINDVIALYIDYYNTVDGGEWTKETTYKRIHQVVTREDAFGLVLVADGETAGFAMGYFSQYDDGVVYDLVEIVIARQLQRQGLGTQFMRELEARVKDAGAFLIQLEAVNDEMHERFYGALGYHTAANLVPKSKIL